MSSTLLGTATRQQRSSSLTPRVGSGSCAGASMATSVAFAVCLVLCMCSVVSAKRMEMKEMKEMKLEVYTQEIRGGPNGTLLAAAGTGQGNFSALGWGSIVTVDNILTAGPTFDSTVLGRFTGLGVITTKGGVPDGGFFAIDQFRFGPKSKYNGSSLSVTGTLASPPNGPWEFVVVGGTGFFRGYSGYAFSTPYLRTTVAPRFVFKWTIHLEK